MRNLFLLFYYYRFFFLFLILQIICWWLIISNNRFVNAAYFNSSNQLVAKVYWIKSGIKQYFSLRNINSDLARENAFLRDLISNSESIPTTIIDSPEAEKKQQFLFTPAKVINKSVNRSNNFLTLDKGSSSGIKSGMGVIGADGVVGQVKAVSDRYTTVLSLLHSGMYISSLHKRTAILCTIHWDGIDPKQAKLLYVPRHINIFRGDTIVTSGYNAIFPESIPIGVVESVNAQENDTFLNIDVKLSVDFQSLSFVYIIDYTHKNEKDSIELSVIR